MLKYSSTNFDDLTLGPFQTHADTLYTNVYSLQGTHREKQSAMPVLPWRCGVGTLFHSSHFPLAIDWFSTQLSR